MSHFILIDNFSGYVFGDTRDLAGWSNSDDLGAADACRMLDESIGQHGRGYEQVSRLASNETGYIVYRVDIDGSEAVPVVHDGQDRETIEAVESRCDLVARILCSDLG